MPGLRLRERERLLCSGEEDLRRAAPLRLREKRIQQGNSAVVRGRGAPRTLVLVSRALVHSWVITMIIKPTALPHPNQACGRSLSHAASLATCYCLRCASHARNAPLHTLVPATAVQQAPHLGRAAESPSPSPSSGSSASRPGELPVLFSPTGGRAWCMRASIASERGAHQPSTQQRTARRRRRRPGGGACCREARGTARAGGEHRQETSYVMPRQDWRPPPPRPSSRGPELFRELGRLSKQQRLRKRSLAGGGGAGGGAGVLGGRSSQLQQQWGFFQQVEPARSAKPGAVLVAGREDMMI